MLLHKTETINVSLKGAWDGGTRKIEIAALYLSLLIREAPYVVGVARSGQTVGGHVIYDWKRTAEPIAPPRALISHLAVLIQD